MDRRALLWITVFAEGGLGLVGLVLLRSAGELLRSRFLLSWCATAYALLFCLPLLAILTLVVRSSWPPLVQLNQAIGEKILPIFVNCKLSDLLLIALLAGVGEELFFRGWLQGLLAGKFGLWVGVLVASFLFGAAHSISTFYALYASLVGLYLGILYYLFGDLYMVMAIHARRLSAYQPYCQIPSKVRLPSASYWKLCVAAGTTW